MPSTAAERAPLLAAAATDTGLRRKNNEDRYHCDPERGLFMVIDGVGGQAAGEKAAETALGMLRARLERETGGTAERLREAITLANNEVHRLAEGEPDWHGMACVLTVAVVRDGRLVVGHVGDTRLYMFHEGRVQKITHDHSPVGEREDRGELDEHDAMRHPRRNEIFRDVGSEPHNPTDEQFIEILDLPFEDDSAILLCSDGLSDLVASTTLADMVYLYAGDPREMVSRLIDEANDEGGKDNITVVFAAGHRFADAARLHQGAGHAPSPPVDGWREEPAGRLNRSRRRRVSIPGWLAIAATLVLGTALGLGLAYLALTRVDGAPEWALQANRPDTWSRTWKVGYEPGAEFTSIEEALAQARPGDTISVGPGEYRAPITMRHGISIVSAKPREAIIRPALGAQPATAVHVPAGTSGRFAGFRISGDAEHPLGVGILVQDGSVEIDDIEVSGAMHAGIVFENGSRATLRAGYIHDNPGGGVVVRSGAAPTLAHNVIAANGRQNGKPRPGVEIQEPASPLLFGNIVLGNGEDQVAGLPVTRRPDVARDNIIGPPPAPPRRPSTTRDPRIPES